MRFSADRLLLYAVTDRAWVGRETLEQQIESALRGGVTLLQLREKGVPTEEFLRRAQRAREICARYNVPLIINDNVEVALRCGADGVHVGAEDTAVADIRRSVPRDFIIGATAKTVEQAVAAERAGADYLGVGAVFPSPTKPNALRITTAQLRAIRAAVTIPVVAIGGITEENLPQLADSGVDGVAVVSAIFGADDVGAAAARLKTLTQRVLKISGGEAT